MQHKLGTNLQKSATIRDDLRDFLSPLTTVIKKSPSMLGGGGSGGISSKMNVPRLSAVELILQLECLKQLLI